MECAFTVLTTSDKREVAMEAAEDHCGTKDFRFTSVDPMSVKYLERKPEWLNDDDYVFVWHGVANI